MKTMRTLLILAVASLSSVLLYSQDFRHVITRDGSRYEGQWPKGQGILYSYNDGLVFGEFLKGKPNGMCVSYRPNGEVYWGVFRKGKATGRGRIYRDNGIVVSGEFRNGRYHGTDTLYRSDGTIHVGKYRKGKMMATLADSRVDGAGVTGLKPGYPKVDIRRKQEAFLNELETLWEERNLVLRKNAGLVNPKFQGGDIEDFALWVNSQVVYPLADRTSRESRTVIVEFTVLKDGTLADVHAVFGSDPVLNEAAVKTVSRSPKWTPGEHKGEKKNVRLSVPVMFSL